MVKIIDRRKQALGGQSNGRSESSITGIAWHYTAVARESGAFITGHENYWKNTLGWRRGGYHYYIDSKGNIYQNYNLTTISNGVRGHNSKIVNISVEANSASNYSKAQEVARRDLTKYLMKRLGLSANAVKQHKEFSGQSTSCAGYTRAQMDKFRQELSGGKVPTVTPSKPNVSSTVGGIAVDGYWGPTTTRKLQQALGTPVDGIISRPSMMVRSLQRLVGARVDGYLGPETYRKLQSYLGTPVDGIVSRPSMMVREMQRRLNAGTFVKSTQTKPKKSASTVANEILRHKNFGGWGTGETRKKRLREAGYNPSEVQRIINRRS